MKSRVWSSHLILLGVVACFVLSGFAALLYQTAWMRQFSLVFGTSELAVAAVLSAYMGGLALGASIAARYIHRVTRPVLFYGVLEAGIAISALAVPLMLQLARFFYVSLLGGQPEPVDASGIGQSMFYLLVAFVVLAIPTALMGATLPLLTKYVVQSQDQIGTRVGLLYATNTLGAIGGTLFAAFYLLPLLGLNGTVWVGVAINLLVFVLAALIARSIGIVTEPSDQHEDQGQSSQVSNPTLPSVGRGYWVLPIMLLSGANSFVYEVLWTRLLGHILGGSIAAFATMLAGFLSGIAIGSAIASRFARTKAQAIGSFVIAQIGISVASVLIYQLLPLVIPESAGLGGNVFFAILILLPATIFIGATFPLAVRVMADSASDAAPASAKVYSWNTVGAIAGATLAAFFIIPLLKYEGTIKLAVLINACLALAAASVFGRRTKVGLASSLVFIFGVLFFYHPKMPEDALRSSPVFAQPGGEILFYEVGRSATVLVVEDKDALYLRTNGLPEAAARVKGAPPQRRAQHQLSVLPVLARPSADSMLVIGFGGGVALEAVPKSVSSIDVVELEPQVIRANEYYGEARKVNPLDDPRINIVINDARSALSLTDKKYDAIVSQPSHPWTAGASHLYTQEFMELAANALTEDGVFLQWMNISFIDEFLLKALASSMLEAFPYARMYQVDVGTLFFIGSRQPLHPERQMATTGRPLEDDILTYLERGVGAPEDLLLALVMDQENMERFAANTPPITDNNNYMATRSSRVLDNQTSLNPQSLYEVVRNFDPLVQADSWIAQDFPTPINYAYMARRLDGMGWHARSLALTERLYAEANTQALEVHGLGLQMIGRAQESQDVFLRALQANPQSHQARYALLQPWFENYFRGRDVPEYFLPELDKLEGSARDVVRGFRAMEEGDMRALLELDAELASVSPTDLWYSTSVKLRAEWRMRLTTPELQPRMYNEATALIDSAMAVFLDVQLYLLRIRSTYLAGDVSAALVTAESLLNVFEGQIAWAEKGGTAGSAHGYRSRLAQISTIESAVDGVSPQTDDQERKVSAIKDSIESLSERIQNLIQQIE